MNANGRMNGNGQMNANGRMNPGGYMNANVQMNQKAGMDPVLKVLLTYLAVSIFCFIFQLVYNHYGHEVTSFFMSWLWLWPAAGCFWYLALYILALPLRRVSRNAVGAGIATFTVGSLLEGIFEIAGTSSPYTGGFFVVGAAMTAAGIFAYVIESMKARNREARGMSGRA